MSPYLEREVRIIALGRDLKFFTDASLRAMAATAKATPDEIEAIRREFMRRGIPKFEQKEIAA